MSAKQAINDKLQGSVGAITTYLRCGGVVNNQTKNGLGLLVSLRVKKIEIGEYFATLQASAWLSRDSSRFFVF